MPKGHPTYCRPGVCSFSDRVCMPVVWNTFRNTSNTFKLQGTRRHVSVHFTHSLHIHARGTQLFQKSRSHLRTLSARRVIWRKFDTKDPKISGATVNNSVARATWRIGFVQHCIHVPLPIAQFSENTLDFIKIDMANINPRTATSTAQIPQNTYILLLEMRFICLPSCSSSAKRHKTNAKSNAHIIQNVSRRCKNGKLVRMWKISWSIV